MKTTLIFLLSFFALTVNAQKNSNTLQNKSERNFALIQENFYKQLGLSKKEIERAKTTIEEKEESKKDGLLNQFHRWEYLMQSRLDANGNIPDAGIALREYSNYKKLHPEHYNSGTRTISWEPYGSAMVPTNGGGAGRINVLEFDPDNSDIMYVGTAGGGVWKSTDAGLSWIVLTDNFPVTGIADLAIDPTNTSIIYAATGDGYGYEISFQSDNDFWGGVYSAGIMKSTDGGNTWFPTGLSYEQDNLEIVQRVIVHPVNANIVIAATRNGIFRSVDAGVTFTLVDSRHCYDFAFNKINPDIIYSAADKDFISSNDAGASWTVLSENAVGSNGRTSIETTAANPNVIYLFNESIKFKRSDDGGVNWVNQGINGTSFYGYYDTDFAVSDVDENMLMANGLEVVVSSNGGDTWQNVSGWDQWGQSDYVHADGHCSKFLPGSASTIFSSNDGGIFKSIDFGTNWTDLSSNLSIAQVYRLGSSLTNPDKALSGWQDNGCNYWDGTTWKQVYGADGMEAAIDWKDENVFYEMYQYGGLSKSVDAGENWDGLSVGGGNWITPFVIDPIDNNILYYGGGSSVSKSTDGGDNWQSIGGSFSGGVFDLQVSSANNQYVYACALTQFKVSKDGGNSWTDITGNILSGTIGFNYIAINSNDAEKVYVVLSGYETGKKVFYSENAGASWINISGTLPNVPVNTIVYEAGSNGAVYIGTDLGVFVKNDTLTDWIPYMDGLPNVMVHELEINNTSHKLLAATYGRGLWQNELYGYVQFAFDAGVVSIIKPTEEVCSETIVASVKVKNYGSEVLTSFNLNYTIDGNVYNVYEWTGVLNSNETITIELPLFIASIGDHEIVAFTSDPNGIADNKLTNDADTIYFKVLELGVILPLTEGFEGGAIPADWLLVNQNNLWSVSNAAGGYGQSTYSLKANFYQTSDGKDYARSPYFDFSGAVIPISLKFDVAYAYKSSTKIDTMFVAISTDCGESYTTVYKKGGDELSTAPAQTGSAFVPDDAEWRTEAVDLSSFQSFDRVLIKWEGIPDKGNNLYIDNINLFGNPLSISNVETKIEFNIFPNPSSGIFEIDWKGISVGETKLIVFNILGSQVYTESVDVKKDSKKSIDLSQLPNGIYQVQLLNENSVILNRSISIQKN